MRTKLLSLTQLFYLAICSFGIQFASALQAANTSSVYKFLGADSSSLPFLWLAAPISGLLMQPIIGQLSDDTSTRFGKRRPYILGWGIITFLGMCLLPMVTSVWQAALLFWLIGCSLNGCMEALRALVGDTAPNEQKTQAFSWQTISSGLGSCLAALSPWLLGFISHSPKKLFAFNDLPFAIQVVFILGAILLMVGILWACWTIQEKIPTHRELLKKQKEQRKITFPRKIYTLFRQIFISIKRTPEVIRKFIIIQIFTWVAIFTLWLYFSMALAQHVYGLPIGVTITGNAHYEAILAKSTVDTGFYFGIYQFVSVLFAMTLPKLSKIFSPKLLHGIALLLAAASLILFGFVKNWLMIGLCMIGFGIMWGSVTVLPLAIVTAEVPRSKMGIYLGIFNITVTFPQIIVGLILGPINSYLFKGHTTYAIVLAGISLLAGGLLMLKQVMHFNLIPGKVLKKQWQN